MNTFTPGPWRTSEIRGLGVTRCVSTDESAPRIICEINCVRSAYAANAALIALAPEMHALLTKLAKITDVKQSVALCGEANELLGKLKSKSV